MDLDELVACIDVLKDRIQSHRASLQENETRTRMALIDPLLRALGWDVADPAMVTPEYQVNGGLADYALLRPEGQPAALLEAKRLGESLIPHQSQMLNYMIRSGIQYGGLTNGDHWELYEVLPGKPLEECRLLDVSIAGFAVHANALKLLLLWRPNLAFGMPVAASAPIFAGQPAAAPAPAPRPVSGEWVALSEYNPPGGTPPPAAIRFWDGSERPLQKWRDMLTSVAEKLCAEKRLTLEDVPMKTTHHSDRYLVHTEPIHSNGQAFRAPVRILETLLFVEAHWSASALRNRTKDMLERCGLNPADVYLRVAQ